MKNKETKLTLALTENGEEVSKIEVNLSGLDTKDVPLDLFLRKMALVPVEMKKDDYSGKEYFEIDPKDLDKEVCEICENDDTGSVILKEVVTDGDKRTTKLSFSSISLSFIEFSMEKLLKEGILEDQRKFFEMEKSTRIFLLAYWLLSNARERGIAEIKKENEDEQD